MPPDSRATATQTPEIETQHDTAAVDDSSVDTLFYDGQCPLCAREIDQLRSVRGDALNLVDIHDLAAEGSGSEARTGEKARTDGESHTGPQSAAPSKDQLLRVLHLRRSDGTWLTSADANVAAWAGTSHGRTLRILRWPIVRYAVDLAYLVWAHWRYRRLYGDQFKETNHAPKQQ